MPQWLQSVLDRTTTACAVSIVGLALTFNSTSSPIVMGLALLSLISFSEVTLLFIRYYRSMEVSFGAVYRVKSFLENTPTEREVAGIDLPER